MNALVCRVAVAPLASTNSVPETVTSGRLVAGVQRELVIGGHGVGDYGPIDAARLQHGQSLHTGLQGHEIRRDENQLLACLADGTYE